MDVICATPGRLNDLLERGCIVSYPAPFHESSIASVHIITSECDILAKQIVPKKNTSVCKFELVAIVRNYH